MLSFSSLKTQISCVYTDEKKNIKQNIGDSCMDKIRNKIGTDLFKKTNSCCHRSEEGEATQTERLKTVTEREILSSPERVFILCVTSFYQ